MVIEKRSGRHGHRGFTFVGVLLLVALVGLGLGAAGPVWQQQAQREKEQELLRIGGLYAEALRQFREASPGNVKQYPLQLEHLLADPRYVGLKRHLRRLYPDPMGPGPWGLVRDAAGGIVGVYSTSMAQPLARGPQQVGTIRLPAAQRYADWKFLVPDSARPDS